jgi:membrane dipeptidase
VRATLEQIDAVHRLAARYGGDLGLATSADEVQRVRDGGRIASLIGMEGGHCIAESLGTLRMMFALGARYLTLTHNCNTRWADSATDTPAVGGLSHFGREVVRECNRLGMLVDLSHVAPATMRASLAVSTAPAFFSHSNARSLCDHPRNVPDDVLAGVRDCDGVVMATFVPGFLNTACRDWHLSMVDADRAIGRTHAEVGGSHEASVARQEALAAWVAANPSPPCGVADVADHIEHIRAVAGVAHVGLGGDFDGTNVMPSGLSGVDGYPAILIELAARGWSDAELAGLTWGNAMRVLRATEAAARVAAAQRGPSLATIAQLDG